MSAFEFFPVAFISFFVVVSPFSLAPIFLAITPDDTVANRVRMARLACIMMVIVLWAFAIAGSHLLSFFGISIAAFQTAGGILLFLIALSMLQAKEAPQKITREDSAAGVEKDDIAVTPLAIPLLAGPGAISTSILLADQASSLPNRIALYLAILAVGVLIFLVLAAAAKGAKWIDPLYLRIGTRLTGLVLAALAIQFIFNGIQSSGLVVQP